MFVGVVGIGIALAIIGVIKYFVNLKLEIEGLRKYDIESLKSEIKYLREYDIKRVENSIEYLENRISRNISSLQETILNRVISVLNK